MITFFRQFRKKLLDNNRLGKYLLYALGEIILVVIGILIAVRINDWNETRKNGIKEVEVLKNLNEDIRYNARRLQEVYSFDSVICERNKVLLQILEDPESSFQDSLKIYFGSISRYDVFSPRRMAFEALKSEGLELIRNEDLRSAIILLYDESYLFNSLVLDMRREIHITSTSLFNKKLFTLETVGFRIPNNFDNLKTDAEFKNTLSYILGEGGNFLRHYSNFLASTRSVEKMIVDEITKRTKTDNG